MPQSLDAAARVALVTGATGGIGSALCRRLATELPSIALAYGSSAAAAEELVGELRATGASAEAFAADMADARAPGQLIERVQRSLGPVDVLIANHGFARRRPYEEVGAEEFDFTLAVNLRAPFLLARGVLGAMRERGFGRILFISSVAAFRGGVVGPDYAASKAGLHGVVHFLASRVAADGVTVNALAPGFIDTPMLPGERSRLSDATPVRRIGTAEEVADLAMAILRNGYVNSQVVSIDGGMYPR